MIARQFHNRTNGTGNFIGLAPDLPLDWVGVEQDPISGAIATALYPHADIRVEGFQSTRATPGEFDLAVGNVPFVFWGSETVALWARERPVVGLNVIPPA